MSWTTFQHLHELRGLANVQWFANLGAAKEPGGGGEAVLDLFLGSDVGLDGPFSCGAECRVAGGDQEGV